jgi:alkylation response protein AidB-like acyl-CoA dehydrogenase
LQQLNKITESEHLEIAASSLGIAQGAYEYASNYARERVQFGRPIVKFEAVQEMLVDMAMSIQIMRVLTYQAGWLADNGVSCLLEAAMARTYAINAVREVCFQALQILGGYGYAMEYDIQRYVRDSLVLLGGGKTVELLKASIGQLLNL